MTVTRFWAEFGVAQVLQPQFVTFRRGSPGRETAEVSARRLTDDEIYRPTV